MEINKCSKCNKSLRIGNEQVGIDDKNIPVYHRFGYCDDCKCKFDIDIINTQNKNLKTPKKNKRNNIWKWIILFLVVFYLISPKEKIEDEKENNKEEYNNEEKLQFSDIETFSNNMAESSDYIDYESSEKLYLFLKNNLFFEKITFKQKNSVGNILFDVDADNYLLMISADNDGIYSIKCGTYTLYDGENVFITKEGLDDRSIDHKSQYYVIAQEIVSNNLKSPKSADFPSLWSDEVKMKRNKDMIIVQSYVDAQNSFGALVRNQWTVEFKILDIDSFSYEIVYINIDGNTAGEYIELN